MKILSVLSLGAGMFTYACHLCECVCGRGRGSCLYKFVGEVGEGNKNRLISSR